jgi:hypothetical protein
MVDGHADQQPAEDGCASDPVDVDEAMGDEGCLHSYSDGSVRVEGPTPEDHQGRPENEGAEADETRVSGVSGSSDDQVMRIGVLLGAPGRSGRVVAWANPKNGMGVYELPAVLPVNIPEPDRVFSGR